MNISIRTKFTLGIIFLFVVIAVLSIIPALYLGKLSKKTDAILKENHLSVIFARDMSESILKINQEFTNSYLEHKSPDSVLINTEVVLFHKSLQLEKNNITEVGEDKLASSIETGFNDYHSLITRGNNLPVSTAFLQNLQFKSGVMHQQLLQLSQLNENAIEIKSEDAHISAKNALTKMTILGTLCFLITFTFTYNFATYFNKRFFQLYDGIKEIVSSNYGHRLYFDGKDEFYEISLLFNKMAEKLTSVKQEIELPLQVDTKKALIFKEVMELKDIIARISSIEDEAKELISRLESNK
jgi:methyl-accepting chemotaxis protein